MAYTRPAHGDPGNDNSATDATVIIDALSTGLEAVEAAYLSTTAGDARYGRKHTVDIADHSPAADGVTDDTAAFTAALAEFGSRGGELVLGPYTYLVPAGITESVKGLVVRGTGKGYLSPGAYGSTGTVIKNTTAGSWGWYHQNDTPAANEYFGAQFEGITFLGDSDTAGGLKTESCSTTVRDCYAVRHTGGIGFLTAVSVGGADDTSWTIFDHCVAQDCLTGFSTGGGGELVNCTTLKTGVGGIQGTGTGMEISAQNVTVLGGKCERDATGVHVTASSGVTLIGIRFEQPTTGIHLDRATAAFGSRIKIVNPVFTDAGTNIAVGSGQLKDTLIGCGPLSGISDSGEGTTIIGADNTALVMNNGSGSFTPIIGKIGGITRTEMSITNQGLAIDARGAAAAGTHAIIQALLDTSSSAYFTVQDGSGANLFRVFGNGQIASTATAANFTIAGYLAHTGSRVGFYNTTPITKPTVTGSRGGNAALASLLTTLANLGLITDSTS